jgi:hypothetical protein
MNSKDATRRAIQALDSMEPLDQLVLVQAIAVKAKDWEELERLTRPIRNEMNKRSRISGKP